MKKNTKKIVIFIICLLVLIVLGYLLFKPKTKEIIITEVDSIEGYNYTLKDNSLEIYKTEWTNLKNNLIKDNVDYLEYAKSISKLFVMEFYSLDKRLSNNDIGGTSFVHEKEIDDFTLKAKNTIYKYVKNNVNGTRNQELPIVSNVEILDVTNKKYEYLDDLIDKNAYYIKVKISYVKDLGYEIEKTLVIVKEDKILKIVELI